MFLIKYLLYFYIVTPTVHSLINDDIILNTTGSKSNSCEVIDSIGHTSGNVYHNIFISKKYLIFQPI